MTPMMMTKEDFAGLGAPDLVYVREIKASDLLEEAVQMKEALLLGDLAQFATVMQSGWQAKKQSAYSITNPMIDKLEELAFANGAHAAKVSGAGGGGFMMFICDPAERVRLVRALAAQGGTVYDTHFTPNGASAWKIG